MTSVTEETMYYAELKKHTIENGTGVRVSLFVSGCRHHCRGCFNEETWDFEYGKPFTEEVCEEIIEALRPDYIAGLTLLGGDPAEPENQEALLPLLKRIKKELPGKDVWIYTGYLYEDLKPQGRAYCSASAAFLSLCDIMVDGPFLLEKKNLSLKFCGSENQRIIDLAETEKNGSVVIRNL